MTPLTFHRGVLLVFSAILNCSSKGMAGAGSFRKTEVRKVGEAGVGREVGNGARGGSGLRSSATDTMAVGVQETQWRCLAYSSLRLQLQLVDEGGARDGRPGEE